MHDRVAHSRSHPLISTSPDPAIITPSYRATDGTIEKMHYSDRGTVMQLLPLPPTYLIFAVLVASVASYSARAQNNVELFSLEIPKQGVAKALPAAVAILSEASDSFLP
jgi:hypothetical protein